MPSLTYIDATSIDGTWTYWVNGTTTSSTVNTLRLSEYGANVWTAWVTVSDNRTQVISGGKSVYAPPKPPTPEELAAQNAKLNAAQAIRDQASARADALLAEFLDAMQRDQLVKDKMFIVESETGKRYEIKAGKRVAELDKNGKPVALYCIRPEDWNLPDGDVMLAQKLMLETDEKSFLKIANRTLVS